MKETPDINSRDFEAIILPHLSQAYNLARWLTRNSTDAEDMVQEACLKAFKHFAGFKGGDAKPWLLAIVRNTFYTWSEKQQRGVLAKNYESEEVDELTDGVNPEFLLLKKNEVELARHAVENLPLEFREVIVLRELEELTYSEIAEVLAIPVGTVMSRLLRARRRLQKMFGKSEFEGKALSSTRALENRSNASL